MRPLRGLCPCIYNTNHVVKRAREEMQEEMVKAKRRIRIPRNQWISTADKLKPKDYVLVKIKDIHDKVFSGWYVKKDKAWDGLRYRGTQVVAWMKPTEYMY